MKTSYPKVNFQKNRLITPNRKNGTGPVFQGTGTLVKGTGNYRGKNGPGS